MIKITQKEMDELDRRLKIAQATVWAASESLDDYGDPTNAGAVTYSFEELKRFLESKQTDECKCDK